MMTETMDTTIIITVLAVIPTKRNLNQRPCKRLLSKFRKNLQKGKVPGFGGRGGGGGGDDIGGEVAPPPPAVGGSD